MTVFSCFDKDKSVSEALILESVNLQYDKRLFIEFPENYKFRIYCIQILLWMSKKNSYTTYSKLVFFGEFNLLPYGGLTDVRIRTSEKYLPV